MKAEGWHAPRYSEGRAEAPITLSHCQLSGQEVPATLASAYRAHDTKRPCAISGRFGVRRFIAAFDGERSDLFFSFRAQRHFAIRRSRRKVAPRQKESGDESPHSLVVFRSTINRHVATTSGNRCTMAMFQVGGEPWERWNGALRDRLAGMQVQGEGCERGSWPPNDMYSQQGGRIYSTALAVLTLE